MRLTPFLSALLLTSIATTIPAHAEGDRSIALIIDASGSMKAKLGDGTQRMDAAKQAVARFLPTLASETRLSLWAYGHQSATAEKNCKDTAQLTKFDSVASASASVVEKARSLEPRGYTPITYAMTLAAQDLANEEAASHVVVLVSDGKETCQADPCAAAKALAEADAKLIVHTVGAGVDEVTRSQLQCIARVARGSYFDANSTDDLTNVLGKAAKKEAAAPVKKTITVTAPKPGTLKMVVAGHTAHLVLDAQGKEVGRIIGDSVKLQPGIYSVTFGNGRWTGIEIKSGEVTEIKPGYLEVDPMGSGFVNVFEPETGEQVEEIFHTKPRATLIPGHFELKMGPFAWPEGVDVKAGEVTTVKPGIIAISSSEIFYFKVNSPDGKPLFTGATPGDSRLTLPPGKYVLELDADKWIKGLADEQRHHEVDVVAGQEVEIEVKVQ